MSVNSSVLNYNLYGRPLNIVPGLVVVLVGAFLVIGVGLSAKRGRVLPGQTAAAETEEIHASPLWALAFAIVTAIEFGVIAVIPMPGLRWVMTLPAILLLRVTALAWCGFHYCFTSHGVAISMAGFRLRPLPLLSIK